jgi:hypothetical protein
LIAGLIAGGCAVNPPQVPRITIPFFISVANNTTTIRQVASDRSEFLQIGSDESLALNVSVPFGESSRQEVGEDRLAVEPSPAEFFTELGDITIEGQDLPPNEVRLGDILPEDVFDAAAVAADLGQSFSLPGQDIEISSIPLELPNVTSLTVIEGGLSIGITNGLPVGLARLEISLRDEGNNRDIDQVVFTNVGPGASADPQTLEFNSAGRDANPDGTTVSGELSLSVFGTTAEADDPELDPDAVLSIDADLLTLTVSEASAIIPQQEFSDTQKLGFPDTRILVTNAAISEGSLVLVVTNEIPVIMSVSLTLPDLLGPDGEPATLALPRLAQDEPTRAEFNLDNHVFSPNPAERDSIQIVYSASTFPSDTEVTIRSNGQIGIEAQPGRLAFSNVTGILDNLTLPIDPVQTSVDFPEGLDNLSLDETFLSVVLTSAVGVTSFMDLVIEGVNSFGEASPTLQITQTFSASSPGDEQRIELSVPSEDLTPFLNSLPTDITVTPTVRIGDGVNEDFIEPDHWIRIDSVNFLAPARFTIESDTQIQPTPDFRELADAEARERISNNLIRGRVFTEINNHLPLGVSVSLRAARRLEDVYNDDLIDRGGAVDLDSVLVIPRNDDPFAVQAAPVDANGLVLDDQVQAFLDTVSVTADEALFFLQTGGVYTGILVQLQGTGGAVELRGDDFITVVAGAGIEIEINESLVK